MPVNFKNYLLAAVSGLLLSCPFSFPNLDFVAWIALIPLMVAINESNFSASFKFGFICGFFHFLSLLYWVVVAIGYYGNLGIFIAIIPLLLLCFYLAIYPALFSSGFTLLNRIPLCGLTCASLWIATEYGRAKLLTGFSWCLLGYSQYGHLYTLQLANVTGVYGISFIIVFINYTIFKLLMSDRYNLKKNILRFLVVIFVVLALVITYGRYSLSNTVTLTKNVKHLNVLIVQPSIDQSKKWDPSFQDKTMRLYLSLSQNFKDSKPDLIVWPETATPFFFQDNKRYASKIISLVKKLQTPLIFGSPAYRSTQDKFEYFNRAYLLTPGNQRLQFYDKIHLVPFGEYVPLEKYLFFIGKLVQGAGNFHPGSNPNPLEYGSLKFGMFICFEAIFPEIPRERSRLGANILVNLTNDAWFGKTTAPFQHLAITVFRAVENRLAIIRAANTGISAFIAPDGKILKKSELFKVQTLRGNVPIVNSASTIYSQLGDFFAIANCIFLAILIGSRLLKRKKILRGN